MGFETHPMGRLGKLHHSTMMPASFAHGAFCPRFIGGAAEVHPPSARKSADGASFADLVAVEWGRVTMARGLGEAMEERRQDVAHWKLELGRAPTNVCPQPSKSVRGR